MTDDQKMQYIPVEQAMKMWLDSRWPGKTENDQLIKLFEEVGEVAGAYTKEREGRSTDVEIQDEIGDVLIVLSTLAAFRGWDLNTLRQRRFEEIVER